MRLDYDETTDSLYIHLSERPAVDSEEVASDIVLDFDEHGTVVGIDIQHASQKADFAALKLHKLPIVAIEAI